MAVMTSSLVFDKTAAMVKPPIRSMIVGENICEKIYLISANSDTLSERATNLVASDAVIRRSASLSVRRTRKNTTSRGTESEVTNSGIACQSASIAKARPMAHLGCPQDRAEDQHGQTIALLYPVERLDLNSDSHDAQRKQQDDRLGGDPRWQAPDSLAFERGDVNFLLDRSEDALISLARDHVRPDGLTVHDDLLSELRAKLLLGGLFVTGCSDSSVQEEDARKQSVELVFARGLPGVRREYRISDVLLLKLLVSPALSPDEIRTLFPVFLSNLPSA